MVLLRGIKKTGEMVQWLRALAALAGDSSPFLASIRRGSQMHVIPAPRGSGTLLWLLQALHSCAQTHRHIAHIFKNKINLSKRAGEVAQQVRSLTALSEDPNSVPSARGVGCSVTAVPGTLTPSAGLHGYCTHVVHIPEGKTFVYIRQNFFKKIKIIEGTGL